MKWRPGNQHRSCSRYNILVIFQNVINGEKPVSLKMCVIEHTTLHITVRFFCIICPRSALHLEIQIFFQISLRSILKSSPVHSIRTLYFYSLCVLYGVLLLVFRTVSWNYALRFKIKRWFEIGKKNEMLSLIWIVYTIQDLLIPTRFSCKFHRTVTEVLRTGILENDCSSHQHRRL